MKKEQAAKPQLVIKCSSCSKPLMSVMMDPGAIDPATKKPFQWKVRASCPYCGDESFVQTLHGRLFPVGWALPNKDNCEDVYSKTFIDETELNNDEVHFKIKICG